MIGNNISSLTLLACTNYLILGLFGETETISVPSLCIPRIRQISLRLVRVAVAVNAMKWTWDGIRLRISLKLENSCLNLSPLHTHAYS